MSYEKQIETIYSISKKLIPIDSIRTILEIGARDGAETVALHTFFPSAKIYSFECNTSTIPLWRERTRHISNVVNIEKAVSDKNGIIDFFPIDQEKTETTWKDGNPGASSLLQASHKYTVETYIQNKTEVQTTRLDTFFQENSIDSVDLVWMDIQGSELMALQGAGKDIQRIKIIHTEVEFFEIYANQPLYKDIKKYLSENGFYLGYFTSFGQYSGDAVFIHSSIATFDIKLRNIYVYPMYAVYTYMKKVVKYILRK